MLAGMMRSNSILGWTSILPMRRCCCATLERKIFTPSLWTTNERAIHSNRLRLRRSAVAPRVRSSVW